VPPAHEGSLAAVEALRADLRLKQRAEYLGPAGLEVAVSLESAFQHILDSLLGFRPCQLDAFLASQSSLKRRRRSRRRPGPGR
jgi:hypothetical protein